MKRSPDYNIRTETSARYVSGILRDRRETVAPDRPGQNGRRALEGEAGQNVMLSMSGVTSGRASCCTVDVTIPKPDGTVLATKGAGTSGTSLAVQLPVRGAYQVVVTHGRPGRAASLCR